ncbi:hypothetical protein [Nocardia sp. NPDC050793]|uniref:hypothetical protein n=1 Tax=Nocardia sp. NPDC050793 TaxID=3155159 RepID=UPI00340D3396
MAVETVAVGAVGACDAEVLRFRDMHSGYVFHVAPPGAHPDLWRRYLRGALRVYRHYEVEPALEYEKVSDGRSTSLFFAAVDPSGEVVAGLRAQGPYLLEDEVHGLGAWAGRPGEAHLRAMIADRIHQGIVEVKAVWVTRDGIAHRAQLGAAISRCVVHAAWLLGARFGFVTAAAHTARLYESSGGRIAVGVPAVPYPDDRYRTVPFWWDTHACRTSATKLQGSLLALERAALGAWFTRARRPATAGDARIGGLAQA